MGQTKNVQDYKKDTNGVRSLVKLFENQALNKVLKSYNIYYIFYIFNFC